MKVRVFQVSHEKARLGAKCPWSVEWRKNGRRRSKSIGTKAEPEKFATIKRAELIGARVEAREPTSGKLLGTRWIHSNHSYKSGGALEAHFGLGKQDSRDVAVILPRWRDL